MATTPLPPPPSQPGAAFGYPSPAASSPGAGTAFRFDASRWQRRELTIGIASLVLLISIFLSWFTASIHVAGVATVSASGSGTAAHGYLYVVFVVSLVILAYIVVRAGFAQLPVKLPVSEGQLVLGLTGVNLLITLIAFLFKPSAGFLAATAGLSVGWAYGAFIGLGAALVAFGAAIWPIVQPRFAK